MSTINQSGSGQSLLAQLSMARDALLAQQTEMNTISHNVANVNTPGFHRQSTILGSRAGQPGVNGRYGAGVEVLGIQRAYVSYLSRQERSDAGEQGRWSAQRDQLTRVEAALNEVGDYGIGAALNNFWNSWEDLANDVDSTSARTNVLNKAADLGYAFGTTYDAIDGQREEINLELRAETTRINELAGRVAGLNARIQHAAQANQSPNDLLDQREMLLRELAGHADITVDYQQNGSANVYLGSDELVHQDRARELKWVVDEKNTHGKASGSITWADTGRELVVTAGGLAGLMEGRTRIEEVLADLDELANAIRGQVNDLHQAGIGADGSTGNAFFRSDVSGARSLEVAEELSANPDKVAASRVSATGDNALAHEMHDLQFSTPFGNGLTINGKYETLISGVGGAVQNAQLRLDTAEAALQQTENLQQQYTGVNLDEEMSQMIAAQHAFQAASKVATTVEEMMNTVINGFAR